MTSRYILILLFCCVYGVISISPFFEKGQRAEIYELMDDEMPTLKINIPDKEYEDLKEGMKYQNSDLIKIELDEDLPSLVSIIKYNLKLFKKINFTKAYPEIDFNEDFPYLQIGEDGYAQYNIEEVFSGYDYDPKHYEQYEGLNVEGKSLLKNMVIQSNKNFDYNKVLNLYYNLEMSISSKELFEIINNITIESWEEEQFTKYVKKSEDNIKKSEDNTDEIQTFKTKNATMTFEINGITSSFKKVTFKRSGALSSEFIKPMYNIKIKNGEDLYGRSNFKLRSDMLDPSYLRSKLVSDIRNRVGIKSISANYVQFYINNEYMGLYIMTDVINLPWIEDVYGEKKTTNLYKCLDLSELESEGFNAYYNGCENKNEDVTDKNEWINFIKTIENATSVSDLEDIIDIDHFLYEMAIDYLTNASDHIEHNFYWYKQPDGKWTYISYDFDLDFKNYGYFNEMSNEEYIKDFSGKERFYDLFISQDHERFNNILKDVINRVFNPTTLFAHIDEVKQFIKPYVLLDKIPDANGKYPGAINENVNENVDYYTFEEWDNSTEITIFGTYDRKFRSGNDAGLKYLIALKYREICNKLSMECDPIYMDENYLKENVKYMGNFFSNFYGKDPNIHDPTDVPTVELFGKETIYNVEEPTYSGGNENFINEEYITESVESVSKNVITKTITKTQTIFYTTMSN